ncbi:pectinesterase inhibitor-like [Primulina tabacum]|uniref:pectinesterase inhibitor-like n=1 Tax=Primulina tabacum TaxID=48773 RepID=UPI003F5AA15A
MSSLPATQVFLILLFFTQVMGMSSNKNVALIQRICKKTNNYSLCVSALKSDPRSLNANSKNLALIMINTTLVKANQISELILKLNKTTSDPIIHACLTLCSMDYNHSIADIQGAIYSFKSSDFEESANHLSFSSIAPGDCEDCFAEPPSRKSPLSDISAYFVSLATIAQNIVSIS